MLHDTPTGQSEVSSGAGNPNRSLAIVSASVLLACATWFSGTAATPQLTQLWELTPGESAWLTISVQLGFILGTLLYAFFNLADVFNARRVFFVSALLGALFNAAFAFLAQGLALAILFRALTGVMLAGVYPVGMKLVASWFQTRLGSQLGIMVGALTMGTALPYLIQAGGAQFNWRTLVGVASLLALLGGVLVLTLLPDGPYLKGRAPFDARMLWRVFRQPQFRHTAFGYFGHMWELYAFWSMVSLFLASRLERIDSSPQGWLPLLSFATIGVGSLGCALGGKISKRVGEKAVASLSLWVSGGMCLLSGFIYELDLLPLIFFILVWGFFVVADSPQFSALAARYCPPEYTGTALTVQNGIGFAITVISIQIIPWVAETTGWRWAFLPLGIGPLIGLYFVSKLPSEQ